ncbi:MAG: hypothetical protein OEV66_01335 [Spirochaetia bacterium]|nr:hypothetical protein [Spirochaetia bacterium]
MGLKDKADSARNVSSSSQSMVDMPGFQLNDEFAENAQIKDILKKKGLIKKEELLKTGLSGLEQQLSRYLLPDDILGSTLPSESDYSLNSRIEALINLLELCKELALTENPEDLWESILFNILGQVGAREAAIFIHDDQRMELKASKGFIFPDEFHLSKRSGIERVLNKDLNIHYGNKILMNIVGDEYNWFSSIQPELIIPVVQYENLFGFILLGKTISAADYSIEDLLYLKLLGEIIGAFYYTISQAEVLNNQKKLWSTREKIYQQYIYFQQQIQSGETPEKTKEIFETYMTNVFSFQAYLFFVLNEKNEYTLVSQKGLQKSSYDNLKFLPGDSDIYKFQQSHGWTAHNNLLENPSSLFNLKFTREDLALFQESQVLSLFFHGSLYGFFILLKVQKEVPSEYMLYAQNLIISYFWYYLSHDYLKKAEKNLKISITDPLGGIKNTLTRQEKKLAEKNISFGLLIVHIANLERISSILGEKQGESIRKKLRKNIGKEFKNFKFISDLFSNKIILIFENIEKSELWLYDKSLVKKISIWFPQEVKRPVIYNRIYHRPEDKEKNLEALINF